MDEDPLDSLFGLEENYYKGGYDLGVADGAHAGFVEGKLFGIEKGYEKGLEIGKLYGKALVWSLRLSEAQQKPEQHVEHENGNSTTSKPAPTQAHVSHKSAMGILPSLDIFAIARDLPKLPANPRLEKHVLSLRALVDPTMLSLENSDDAVADLDDRLKKASAKAKIIERIIGESSEAGETKQYQGSPTKGTQGGMSNNIEELRNSYVRR